MQMQAAGRQAGRLTCVSPKCMACLCCLYKSSMLLQDKRTRSHIAQAVTTEHDTCPAITLAEGAQLHEPAGKWSGSNLVSSSAALPCAPRHEMLGGAAHCSAASVVR